MPFKTIPEPQLDEPGTEPCSYLPIQLRLSVGAADDPLEHEADAMADKVMRMPETSFIQRKSAGSCGDRDDEHVRLKPLVSQITPFIQRKSDGGSPVGDSLSGKIQSSMGGGNPMRNDTKSFMESRFGTDFSDVKIHSGGESAELNRSLNAKAFTVSNNIYFNNGQYQPETDSGKHLLAHELTHVVQQSGSTSTDGPGNKLVSKKASAGVIQRQPKPAPAAPTTPAGGNILYIGMNNYKPELARLKQVYKDKPVIITSVTVSREEKATKVNGGVFDLTTPDGAKSFANSMSTDPAKVSAIEKLIKGCSLDSEKDDLAHVIGVYVTCQNDGKDRMTRVVLSGHSTGSKIYNDDEIRKVSDGEIRFEDLVTLAGLFPKAAGQTKHLFVMACFAGTEDNIKNFFLKAFPNLMTASAWVGMSPTGFPAAEALEKWAKTTDPSPTKLDKPGTDRSNWALGDYHTDDPVDAVALMAELKTLEPKFNEYFEGKKVDPDGHSGFVFDYYRKARTAEQMTSEITGADHDYSKIHADQSFRIRFWPSMVSRFWKKNSDTISKAYGPKVPTYGSMSRKDALAAIAQFDTEAKGSASDIAVAKPMLIGLKNLSPDVLSDTWVS